MPGARSSCWPIWPRMPGARRRARQPAVISPLALEAVRRIDALFEIERAINGQSAERAPGRPPGAQRAAGRRSGSLDARAARQALARQRCRQGDGLHAQALDRRSPASSTTAASACRTMPPSARCAASPWAESRGCSPAPIAAASAPRSMYSLIVTAKMNDVDPQAWLADVLARIAEHPAHQLDELLPWNWRSAACQSGSMSGTQQLAQTRCVIFLNGPIGVGKTVLGRLATADLGASFIDSDDLGDPSKQWFEQVLSTATALVHAGIVALRDRPVVIVATPLRTRDWIFFKGHFEAEDVTVYCITLTARLELILGSGRGREFDAEERVRIKEMIAQGYASRPFSHAIVETDRASLANTADRLVGVCRSLLASEQTSPIKTQC